MSTDQEVGDSSSSGRAGEAGSESRGLRSVTIERSGPGSGVGLVTPAASVETVDGDVDRCADLTHPVIAEAS
jgi:hypothetical protein